MTRRWRLLLALAPWLVIASLDARTVEVQVELPSASRIDMEQGGYENVLVAPFLYTPDGKRSGYAYGREVSRFLERLLTRRTDLVVKDTPATPLPFQDVEALAEDAGFWKTFADENQADLVLAGAVTFRTQNRSGYVRNTYRSAVTGKSYQDKPTFVYRSGVTLSLDVLLIEGDTGEVLYRDRLVKDRTVDGGGGDPLQNFFDLMRGVAPSVLGIITPQKTLATRYLLD